MSLFKHYRKAVIYPAIFIQSFCVIYAIIDNYSSGWQSAKSVILMSYIASLIFSILMCVFSSTIFLNKFDRINRNLTWNILAWFLLPFGYIALIYVFEIENRIKFGFGFGNDFLYLLIMTVPFAAGLFLTFIKYRQEITNTSTL